MNPKPEGTNPTETKEFIREVEEKVDNNHVRVGESLKSYHLDEQTMNVNKKKLANLIKNLFECYRRKTEQMLKQTDNLPVEITCGLYIGSIGGAKSKMCLQNCGITHIVSCASTIPPQFPEDFKYLHMKLEDRVSQTIDDMFDCGIPFIRNALEDGGKVFVHCFAGKSRATTMCCAYLIHSMQIPLSEALALVQKVRPIADPNIGFRNELVKFAKSLGIHDPSIEKPQPVKS